MANEGKSDAAHWLVEPLQSKEVRIFVAVAQDAELTPEMRGALEQLAAAMQASNADNDVQGYRMSAGCTCDAGSSFSCSAAYSRAALPGLTHPTAAPVSFGLFQGTPGPTHR